jgi:hypothetical protein
MKRTQVKGERYNLPPQEIEIEKLIQKGLTLEDRFKEVKQEMEGIKTRLTEIAAARRQGTTTVNLKGISGGALVTFRESYECRPEVEDLKLDLKDLWERFFTKKIEFVVTKDLVNFLESDHGLGLANAPAVKKKILGHLTKKEIKPNVKISLAASD